MDEEILKEQVNFSSIESQLRDQSNIDTLENKLMKLRQSDERDDVAKQIGAYKKAQQSYSHILEATSSKINIANVSTRQLSDIQKNQAKFISKLVLKDHHIINKEARNALKTELDYLAEENLYAENNEQQNSPAAEQLDD